MQFNPAAIPGVFVIDIHPIVDARGFFARTWCRNEFQARGLNTVIEQESISFNRKKGTLRGMHYQDAPNEEVKLIRCTRGAIYDAVVDLRKNSPTFRHWFAVELIADNGKMVYAPAGVAHGFQTLSEDSEVFYQISEAYHPEKARGVRWNDPVFRIQWPLANPILSVRDQSYPDFL